MEEKRSSEIEESFFQKLFSCCVGREEVEFEISADETDRLYSLGDSKMTFENELSLFPTNLIRPEEKNKIKFTKDELIEYIHNLQNLVFPVIYDDNIKKISKRNYTELNEKTPLIRVEIIKHKIYFTEVPSILKLDEAINNPKIRKKWDKNIKEYKIMRKIKKKLRNY